MKLMSAVKLLVVSLLVGLVVNINLYAYKDTLTVEENISRPAWQQDSDGRRFDTLYVVLEKVNPENVWFRFGASLLIVGPTLHPLSATYQDSIDLSLEASYVTTNLGLDIQYNFDVHYVSDPKVKTKSGAYLDNTKPHLSDWGDTILVPGNDTVVLIADVRYKNGKKNSVRYVSDLGKKGNFVGSDDTLFVLDKDTNYYYAGGFAYYFRVKHLITSTLVTFNQSGGTGGRDTLTATNGSIPPSITVPTKSCSTFVGYYTAPSGGVKVFNDDGTPVSNVAGYTSANGSWTYNQATLTLYARWTENTYTLDLASAGHGSVTSNQSNLTAIPCSAEVVCTASADTGYQFQHWTRKGSSAVVSTANPYSFSITGNDSLVANFIACTYSITYNANEGTGTMTPTSFTIEDLPVNLPTQMQKPCSTFVGWFDTPMMTGTAISQITTLGDKTFYAKFTQDTFNIIAKSGANGQIAPSGTVKVACGETQRFTFTPNTAYEVETITVGSTKLQGSELTNAVANGYEMTNVTANDSIQVTFAPIEYTIEIVANGGTATGDVPTTYTIETPTITLPTFTKVCETFNGLYETPDFKGPVITEIPQGSTGDKTFYAKFTQDTFNIVAKSGANGQIAPSGTVKVACGETQRFTFTPNTGYEVESITVNTTKLQGSELTKAIANGYEMTNVTENDSIQVTFKPIVYTIKIMANGGVPSSTPPTSYTIETPTITLPVYMKDCETFGGLYENANFSGSPITQIIQGSTGNKMLYAKFTKDSFNIVATAGPNGSISPSGTIKAECGSSLTVTFAPDAGYQVDVVTVNSIPLSESSGTYNFIEIREDATIHVTFKPVPAGKKTITILSDPPTGGTTKGAGTYDSASVITITASPNANYKFEGWTDKNGVALSSSDTVLQVKVISDTVIIAHFSEIPIPNSVIITLEPEDISLSSGETLTLRGDAEDTLGYDLAWQWYHNDTPILGAIDNTYIKQGVTSADEGEYYFIVTNAKGYTQKSKVITVNITSGIREEKQHLTIHLDGKKIALYNPEHLQIYELQVIDVLGTTCVSLINIHETTLQLPTTLPLGRYWLLIRHASGYEVHKLLIME